MEAMPGQSQTTRRVSRIGRSERALAHSERVITNGGCKKAQETTKQQNGGRSRWELGEERASEVEVLGARFVWTAADTAAMCSARATG